MLLSLFLAGGLYAQEVSKTGTTAAKFLNIGIGPRANAMGGAYTAVADGPAAMAWNPAGIASADRYNATFSYVDLFADINLNYVGVIIPFEGMGNLGISVISLDVGEMDVTTENYPEGTGEKFTPASYAFGISFARYITTDFAVGISAKYIRESIYNSSADGFSFDIGTVFKTPFYGVKFASSITNWGTKMQMSGTDLLIRYDADPNRAGNNESVDAYIGTDEFDLPLRLQIGFARDFIILEEHRITVAVDGLVPSDNHQSMNVGGELALFQDLIMLRAGYKSLFLDESQEGLSLGFGLNYSGLGYFGLGVDYSYQDYEYLEEVHNIAVTIKF